MNCTDARRAISSGFDGDDLDLSIDRHLSSCAACGMYADRLLTLRRELRIGAVETVPDIAASVMTRIDGRRPNFRRRRFSTTAAAVVALGLASVTVGQEATEPRTGSDVVASPGDILVAWSDSGLPSELGELIAGWSQVDAATEAHLGTANLSVDGTTEESVSVEVFGYDPATYPPFASATNRAEFTHLGPREAMLSNRAATMRGLRTGDTLTFDNGVELQVKGVVPDDDIAAAEIAVTNETAETLGDDGRSYLLIEHDESYRSIEADISEHAEGISFRVGGDASFLRGGEDPTPTIDRKEAFGEFTTLAIDDNVSAIDPLWRDAHITESNVPILGVVTCHRQVLLSLASAMYELERTGATAEIDAAKSTRCFTPRVDPNAAPDLRNWGIVVDLNYDPATDTAAASDALIAVMEAENFTAYTDDEGTTTFVWQPPS